MKRLLVMSSRFFYLQSKFFCSKITKNDTTYYHAKLLIQSR